MLAIAPAPAAGAQPAASARAHAPALTPATAEDLLAAVAAAKGRVVLLNAWATWCIPCRQEMPDLLKLRSELAERGFELMLVSADFDDAAPQARAFLGEKGVTFRTFHKRQPDQEFIDGLDPSWSGALPYSALFDRRGVMRASWEGRETLDQLRARVLSILDQEGTP